MAGRVLQGRALNAWVLVTLIVLPLLVLVAGVANASVVGASPNVGASVSVERPVEPTSGERCEEDSACFNPCTMGVNGEYPTSDARHYVPGPCRLDTVLPYGLRFQLIAEPVDGVGVVCAAGESFMQVTLLVVNPDVTGDIRAEKYSYGCAGAGDPFVSFASVLPGMYRALAAELDR